MARMWIQTRGLLDMVIEEVACKSGVLLTDHDVFSLLEGSPLSGWAEVFRQPPERLHGVRPEFIVDAIRTLRAAVGNLPDATPGVILSIRYLRAFENKKAEFDKLLSAWREVLSAGRYKVIGEEFINEVVQISGVDRRLAERLFLAFGVQQERDSAEFFFGRRRATSDWDGRRPLSELFKGESIPDDPERYLDQRFIDYLAAQGEQLDKMHWRNFERLTAEFFKRAGCEVSLGPGTKDGGVDVRVWPERAARSEPPLLLVQCKRYRQDKLVDVEYVKALWADVQFEEASRGLIATTSRVSPDGRRICEARKYTLSFAENEQVRNWARSMWRYAWHSTTATVHVGRYLIPPVITPGVFEPYGHPPSQSSRDRNAKRKKPKRRRG